MSSSSSTPSTGPTPPAKRACDSCHRRKVKCLPMEKSPKPCRNCVTAGLECTFYNKVQKKGPKGSRAKVLSEIRENQNQKLISPRPPYDHNNRHALHGTRSSSPSSFERTPGLLSRSLIDSCSQYFFNNMYFSQPILHIPDLLEAIEHMNTSIEAYCKLAALCAYVLFQPQSYTCPDLRPYQDSDPRHNQRLALMLFDEAIRVRKGHEPAESPDLYTIYTSYYLARCHQCLGKQDAAWIELRNAVTFAHVLGLHLESTYSKYTQDKSHPRRKLFWVLFVAERVHALRQQRPLSLSYTIRLPSADMEFEGPEKLRGFLDLVELYRFCDDRFFSFWNGNNEDVLAPSLNQLQVQLANVRFPHGGIASAVAVDLEISRSWLRSMIWQLAVVRDAVPDHSMASKLLLDICENMADRIEEFTPEAKEANGIELVEKIFDVACRLSNYIQFIPYDQVAVARNCLQRLYQQMSTLSCAQTHHRPELQQRLMQHFPNQPAFNYSPIHQNVLVDNSMQHIMGLNSYSHVTLPVSNSLVASSLAAPGEVYGGIIGSNTTASYTGYVPQSSTQVANSGSMEHGMPFMPYRSAD